MTFNFHINDVSLELMGKEQDILFTGIFEHAINSSLIAAKLHMPNVPKITNQQNQNNKENIEDLDCSDKEPETEE